MTAWMALSPFSAYYSFINMLIASGADPKTVMKLNRHATVSVTFEHYGRANAKRMTQAAETAGEIVLGGENARDNARQESNDVQQKPQPPD